MRHSLSTSYTMEWTVKLAPAAEVALSLPSVLMNSLLGVVGPLLPHATDACGKKWGGDG